MLLNKSNIKYVFLFCFTVFLLSYINAQEIDPSKKVKFHPEKFFAIELYSTIGLGKSSNTFIQLSHYYTFSQKKNSYLDFKTGIGVGYMNNFFGKLVTLTLPLDLEYCYGKRGHYLETGVGGRLNFGFSLAQGVQVIPLIHPYLGYRYQVMGQVFFKTNLGFQYHPNLGFSPIIQAGIGYDY